MCNRIINDNTLRLQSTSLLITMKQKVYPQVDNIPEKVYSDWLYMRTEQSDYKKCYKPYRTLNNY